MAIIMRMDRASRVALGLTVGVLGWSCAGDPAQAWPDRAAIRWQPYVSDVHGFVLVHPASATVDAGSAEALTRVERERVTLAWVEVMSRDRAARRGLWTADDHGRRRILLGGRVGRRAVEECGWLRGGRRSIVYAVPHGEREVLALGFPTQRELLDPLQRRVVSSFRFVPRTAVRAPPQLAAGGPASAP